LFQFELARQFRQFNVVITRSLAQLVHTYVHG
jgi:hypothetical protein